MVLACLLPHIATTELLLQATSECDYDWDLTLEIAIGQGETEVVKLLMQDSRVDPTLVHHSTILSDLSDVRALKTLSIFVTDPRVKLSNPVFFGMAYALDHIRNEDGTMDGEKLVTVDHQAMMREWASLTQPIQYEIGETDSDFEDLLFE